MDDYSTKNARDVTFSQLYLFALAGIPLTLTDQGALRFWGKSRAAAKRLWAVYAK